MANCLCNGKFDLIHAGHFNILNYCRRLVGLDGTVIVAIDSDKRIKTNNDPHLPIFSQDIRIANLRVLKILDVPMVNRVIVFNTDDDLRNIIKSCQPDFFVKGSEWNGKKVIGDDIVQVRFYPVEKNGVSEKISSSSIIEAVLKRYKTLE